MSAMAARCAQDGYDEVTLCSVHRDDQPLHELILNREIARQPDLVVKAASGADDRQLIDGCAVPVLLAGARAWSPTPRIAVALDVSDSAATRVARRSLQAAGFLALGCLGRLDVLYAEREEHEESVRVMRAVRLAKLVRELHVGCDRLQIFNGAPERKLPPLFAARGYDLVVLGAGSQRYGDASWLHSLTSKLIAATRADVLLVPGEPAASAASRTADASGWEQGADLGEQFV
jgi:nucleotide-binding universal stress UspA family protein